VREHVALAAAIGIILGALAPEVDFRTPEVEAARFAPPSGGSECGLPKPEPVQIAAAAQTAFEVIKCALPEEEAKHVLMPGRNDPQ
jgi:hypothetical protein